MAQQLLVGLAKSFGPRHGPRGRKNDGDLFFDHSFCWFGRLGRVGLSDDLRELFIVNRVVNFALTPHGSRNRLEGVVAHDNVFALENCGNLAGGLFSPVRELRLGVHCRRRCGHWNAGRFGGHFGTRNRHAGVDWSNHR